MRVCFHNKPALIIAVCFLASSAYAGTEDGLDLTVGENSRYESNVFRLPNTDSAFVKNSLGESRASDFIAIGYGEFRFNQGYSLQRVELDAKLSRYQYNRFDYLNYTAHEYSAKWGWSLTPRVKGELSAERAEKPESFWDTANRHARNINLSQGRNASIEAYLSGSWYLLGGAGFSQRKNDSIYREQDDFSQYYDEYGIKYLAATGSFVDFLIRNSQGEYSDRDVNFITLQDNKYTQKDLEAAVNLNLFDKSRLSATLTRFDRTHKHFESRDYDGTNWTATYFWDATAKLFAHFGVARRYDPFQDLFNSYVIADSRSLVVDYLTSAKSSLKFEFTEVERGFNGGINAPFGRTDQLKSSALVWSWSLSRAVNISPALTYQRFMSNIDNREYDDFTASLGLSLTI